MEVRNSGPGMTREEEARAFGADRFVATSCQYTPPEAGNTVEILRLASLQNGQPWVIEVRSALDPGWQVLARW